MPRLIAILLCYLLAAPAWGQEPIPILFSKKKARISTENILALYDMKQGANAQRLYNIAYSGPRTNYAVTSDDFTRWLGTGSVSAKGLNYVTFGADANAGIYPQDGLSSVVLFAGQSGSWTITCEAKLESGTGVFRLGFLNSGSAFLRSTDKAINDAWQVISYTWTGTVSGGLAPAIYNGSDGAGRTIQIKNLRFNAGSADLGAETMPVWDGWLGQTSAVESGNDPTFTSTGASFGGTKQIFIPSNSYTFSAYTVYCLYKWIGDPVSAGYAYVFGPQAGSLVALSVGTSSPYPQAGWPAYGINPNDGNYHVFAWAYNSSGYNNYLYLDGLLVDSGALGSPVTGSNWHIGTYNYTSGFPGEIDLLAIYSTTHSQSTITANTKAIWEQARRRGIAKPLLDRFMVVDGDSFSERNTGVAAYQKYPYVAASAMDSFLQHRSFATSSYRIDQLDARAPTGVDAYRSQLPSNTVLVVWAGANDVAQGADAATVYARLQTYCANRRAAGWSKIILLNMLPRDNLAGYNTTRNAVNALLAADHTFVDALVDVAADPTIGPDGSANNATYFYDGWHPAAAAHAIVGPLLKTALDAVL